VSLNALLRKWRKALGLKGKEWCCRNCRYGVLPDEDVCGYVTPNVIYPRVCAYVEMRIHGWLAQEVQRLKGLANARNRMAKRLINAYPDYT